MILAKTSTHRTRRLRARRKSERAASSAEILQLKRALRAERERADAATARVAVLQADHTAAVDKLIGDAVHAALVDERRAIDQARAGIIDLQRQLAARREDVVFVVTAMLYTYALRRDGSPEAFATHAVDIERKLRRATLGLPEDLSHPLEATDVPSLLVRCLIQKPKSVRFPAPQDPILGLVERGVVAHQRGESPATPATTADIGASRREATLQIDLEGDPGAREPTRRT